MAILEEGALGYGSGGIIGIRIIEHDSLSGVSEDVKALYGSLNESGIDSFFAFPRLQLPHTAASRDAIGATAEMALRRASADERPWRAFVAGPGPGFDTPFDLLVDEFDEVIFADTDPACVEAALDGMTEKQLGKISVVGADVTGCVAELTDTVCAISEASDTLDEFVARATPFIRDYEPAGQQPPLGADYAFVCSQLIMTQLAVAPARYITDHIITGRYGADLDKGTERVGTIAEAIDNALNAKLQVAHIEYLARLVRKTGTVHFADTYAQASGRVDNPTLLPMVDYESLTEAIDNHFVPLAPRQQWLWRSTNKTGYLVIASALAPKGSANGYAAALSSLHVSPGSSLPGSGKPIDG